MNLRRVKREIFEIIKIFLTALIISLVIKSFIFESTAVNGNSMNPTLEHNDKLIVNKLFFSLKDGDFHRGDIITFKSPLEEEYYIKRVIGISGDTLRFENGKIYVNSELVREEYIDEEVYTYYFSEGEDIYIGPGELFVVGDNRLPGESYDSRAFGTISIDSVRGKALFRFLPFKKMGSI